MLLFDSVQVRAGNICSDVSIRVVDVRIRDVDVRVGVVDVGRRFVDLRMGVVEVRARAYLVLS